jgi:AraC family transcriptional regulator of adaptative response / DNA-3-methyladenine glycosylase II
MTPGELRRTASAAQPADRLAFDLAYRPPYDWEAMLAFLERRAIRNVEARGCEAPAGSKTRGTYSRTVRVTKNGKPVTGWISVAPSRKRSALRVTVSASLAGALPAVLSRVKHLFDLACRPEEIAAVLGALAAPRPGLRLPGAVDGFEVAVRAILGQQITVKAASTLAGRFVEAYGDAIETPHAALSRLFPTPATVAALDASDIASRGIIAARARAIVALAQAMASGSLRLDPTADVDATIAALETLPGVGPWTAQYIAMRALAWPDAFPHPDVAVLKAMKHPSKAKALEASAQWRPWRAYAVLHLWKSLEKSP